MNLEIIKNEFIKLKKQELDYIDNIAKISSNKILTEYEKLEIHRTLNNYENKLNESLKELVKEATKDKKLTKDNYNDTIIEFNINKDFLSFANFKHENTKEFVFNDLGINIETYKFKLNLRNLYRFNEYKTVNYELILNKQTLIENPIYIFTGYYDSSEDCYGPCFGERDEYLYANYENVLSNAYYNDKKQIPKKDMNKFEKNKIIIHSKRYVGDNEIKNIFKEELLNIENKTIIDCVTKTKKRIDELNHIKSPEYKEKVLLHKINELYKKVKGEYIQKRILYTGNFISILKETYKLPNRKIVHKEKVIKNKGKDSVIIIPLTQDNKYLITFQNRIQDKIIAEFPSGYIENNEEVLDAAKRELQEETGYITDDLFIVDEAYTSPGTDNSTTYIVIANNCIKTNKINTKGTELINYGLFSEKELKYLISSNIMNGAMNKLAYYNLINNVDDCNVHYINSNKKIYIKKKNKPNPQNYL